MDLHLPDRFTWAPVPRPLLGAPLRGLDEAVLKVALRFFAHLADARGPVKGVFRSALTADPVLVDALGGPESAPDRVASALARLVEGGLLLEVPLEGGEALYLLNTPRHRAWVESAQQGRARLPAPPAPPPAPAGAGRSDLFRLYEENIGPITPLVAERLKALEADYSPEWLEGAVWEAVRHNRRRLSYIEAVLRRWEEEGRGPDGVPRRHPEAIRIQDYARWRREAR